MELIDRYLQSVRMALPKAERNDVIRELTDEILSQVEEKEAALGRPLNEDEQVDLLKQLGHPLLLAGRYRKQRYLIDPPFIGWCSDWCWSLSSWRWPWPPLQSPRPARISVRRSASCSDTPLRRSRSSPG